MGREEYMRQLLEAYRKTPGTTGTIRRPDRMLAAQLHQRGVPLRLVENALVLAAARRLMRPDAPPLGTIRSLAYFLPVIEEVLEGKGGARLLQLSPLSPLVLFSQHGQDARQAATDSRPSSNGSEEPRFRRGMILPLPSRSHYCTPAAWMMLLGHHCQPVPNLVPGEGRFKQACWVILWLAPKEAVAFTRPPSGSPAPT